MSLLNSLVPVSDINCNFPCQTDPSVLQHAAQLIIDGAGIINPLILRPIGIDHYELVDGVFEYYAAIEAEKIEPMRNELINAYIIKPEQEQIFANQIETFRQHPPLETNEESDNKLGKEPKIIQQLLNQNAILLNKVDELTAEVKSLKSMLEQLVANSMNNDANQKPSSAVIAPAIMINQLPIATTPVAMDTQNAVKTVPSPVVEISPIQQPPTTVLTDSTLTFQATPPIISAEDAFIEFLNKASLDNLKDLKSSAHDSELNGLLKKRKMKGQFKSKADCLKLTKGQDGLTPGRYDALFNKWQQKYYCNNTANDLVTPSATLTKNTEQNNNVAIKEPIALVPTSSIENIHATENENVIPPTITPEPIRAETLPPFTPNPIVTPLALTTIEKLNNMSKEELAVFLSRLKFTTTIIEAILEQRPFASFDAINIKGLGVKSKQKLMDAFNK